MKELIDKAAVMAEIESLRRTTFTNFDEGVNATVQTLLEVVNTLETKTVDLEKEIDDYWCSLFCDYKMKRVAGHKFVPVPEYIDENFNQCENGKTQIAYVLEVDWKTDFNDNEWNGDDVMKFAQYFYELGLKGKGEVYVVTRSEEHADYVEAAFLSEDKAKEYCKPFNEDENCYARDITKVKIQ